MDSGEATITNNEIEYKLKENQSAYILKPILTVWKMRARNHLPLLKCNVVIMWLKTILFGLMIIMENK